MPIDKERILESLEQCNKKVLVVEDHFENGGLGDHVRRVLTGKQCEFVHRFVTEVPFSAKPADLYK